MGGRWGGHRDASPVAAGPVEHGLAQPEAVTFAGETPALHLHHGPDATVPRDDRGLRMSLLVAWPDQLANQSPAA
jgi:hypothetical protein